MQTIYFHRPTVRFSAYTNAIYGFPPSVQSFPEPGWLYLDNPPPAVRDYILGTSWRTRLVNDPTKSDSRRDTYVPIFKTTQTRRTIA